MHIVEGDLWSFYDQGYYAVIPTNRTIRHDGAAIMGRGVAQQAAQRFPKLPRWYGAELRTHTHFKIFHEQRLVMFPVKNDWREQADLELIKSSCSALRTEALRVGFRSALPLVGCGFGELSEEQVIPLLETHLPQSCFTLVRRGAGVKELYPRAFVAGARRDAS